MLGAIDWGTVAEWVSGVAGFGALGISLWVLGLELDRNRTDQARRVAAWVHSRMRGSGGTAGTIRCSFKLRNGSPEPVYEAAVHCELPDGSTRVIHRNPMLGPEEQVEGGPLDLQAIPTASDNHVLQMVPRLGVTFTDSAGRQWTRQIDGRLTSSKHGPR